jgi:uncharacterized protein GlcG (DUF336 family)
VTTLEHRMVRRFGAGVRSWLDGLPSLVAGLCRDWGLEVVRPFSGGTSHTLLCHRAGVPVVLRRLTGASPRSQEIATRKAATVVATRLATSVYGEQLKAGSVKEVPNGITFAGGVPIMRGAEFIGAIGTSGVRAVEDEQISKAGAAAIK